MVGLFTGSLFAAENNMMMGGMDKEKCMAMHKSMHENEQITIRKIKKVIKHEKHQQLLNSKNSGIWRLIL